MAKTIWPRIAPVVIFALLLAVWQWATSGNRSTIVPSPWSCFSAFVEMVQNKVLWDASITSLRRVLAGFMVAFCFAVASGVAVGMVPVARIALTPVLEVLRPIPPIAWIPLAVSLFGIGDASTYFIIFTGAFFPIFTNLVLGITSVERGYLDVAKVFGASGLRSFLHVILPSSLPSLFAGMRVGLGFAWMCVVAAEMFAARSGLGYEIQLNRQLFRLDRVVVGMVMIGLIGYGMNRFMIWCEWLCVPWRRNGEKGNRQARTGNAKARTDQDNQDAQVDQRPELTRFESPRSNAFISPHGATVEIANVSFQYANGPTVLQDLNLRVRPGELYCILGRSGCGKSTLLRLLAGLEDGFSGNLLIDEMPPKGSRTEITMVFQSAALFPWKRALANVRFALNAQKRREARDTAAQMLALVGLEHKAKVYPHQLSGGQQQRVSVARALATGPQLLLLDEPFSALDNQTREQLQEEVSVLLRSDRVTTIMVTHDIAEAIFMADRIAIMSPKGQGLRREFPVPVSWPRPETFRTSPQFHDLHAELWTEMRSQV